MKGKVASLTLSLILLGALPGTPARAAPVCTGEDRTLCGGRIIPEPTQSIGFLTYEEWSQAMTTLQREHPDHIRFNQIGTTSGKRPLYEVLVTDFNAPTPIRDRIGLYFNGDIHGDERDGTEGFARAIEDLAESEDPDVAAKLSREVLVFTDVNPDGWQTGDVPEGLTSNQPIFKRENDGGHDLNRQWPTVGFQNPETFPLGDPEVRSIVRAHGDLLHRGLGLRFAYAFDVHGSAGAQMPPSPQLMLDVLVSAGQHDLTRSLLQTRMAEEYMRRLEATTSDNTLAQLGALTGHQLYKVGDWDTSWDIYGYAVSGGFSDWMADDVTGLGAVSATIELWLNGEPGQENTFLGYNQLIEASNVHSMRVIVATVMDLAARRDRAAFHLPGPVATVLDRASLGARDGKGSRTLKNGPSSVPPAHAYPAAPSRFWTDLAADSDHTIEGVTANHLSHESTPARFSSIVVPGDAHLDDAAFVRAIGAYARAGGTIVLTDGALRVLTALGLVPSSAVGMNKVYAGYVEVADPDDPLARGLRGPSQQKQTYEPVPLGYAISNTFSSSNSAENAPAWWVDRSAWEAAGGRTAGTTGKGKTSLGEIRLGKGRIRILGSLLPPPSGDWDHPFGVADYAVTYLGYTLLGNLLGASASLEPVSAAVSPPRRPETAPTHRRPAVEPTKLPNTGAARAPIAAALTIIAVAVVVACWLETQSRKNGLV